VELFGAYGDMFNARAWPTSYTYWSATPVVGSNYHDVILGNGSVGSYNPHMKGYASCVSNP
jgi:hypothetical protein